MRETLGLDDPLDQVELREELERSFGLRFGLDEAAGCWTVGDVLDVLCRHLEPARPGACATAMAFYRLRRALARRGMRNVAGPGDDLAAACRGISVRCLVAGLERETGLKLPRPALGPLGQAGACLVAASVLAPAWWLLAAVVAPAFAAWWLPAVPLACGLAILKAAPRRLPAGCRTLGGLARRTAALNFATLGAEGAAARPREVQAALMDLLAGFTSVPATEIGPATRIAGPRARAA